MAPFSSSSLSPPHFSLSLSFSLHWPLSLSRPSTGSLTTPLQSPCLGQREAPWEFNCFVLPKSQDHYIKSSNPHGRLLTCRNLFLVFIRLAQRQLHAQLEERTSLREKVRERSASTGVYCDAPAGRIKTWQWGGKACSFEEESRLLQERCKDTTQMRRRTVAVFT